MAVVSDGKHLSLIVSDNHHYVARSFRLLSQARVGISRDQLVNGTFD
ncbi:hypothetical protein H8B02_19670 [Bradyrhizobium sp. Pear77]|nr:MULTISPECIES: hypothetical protein [Bradyrhizobium]MCC8955568.1 hypothetical protein [Bradyrhizobium altum]MCC8963359.1 hypothetical protein [Bradyrhizobium oropedii]